MREPRREASTAGWYVAMRRLLDFERSNIGGAVGAKRTLQRLLDVIHADSALASKTPRPVRHDAKRIEAEVMYQFSLRIISMQNRGPLPTTKKVCRLYNKKIQRLGGTAVQALASVPNSMMEATQRRLATSTSAWCGLRTLGSAAKRHRHPRSRTPRG